MPCDALFSLQNRTFTLLIKGRIHAQFGARPSKKKKAKQQQPQCQSAKLIVERAHLLREFIWSVLGGRWFDETLYGFTE